MVVVVVSNRMSSDLLTDKVSPDETLACRRWIAFRAMWPFRTLSWAVSSSTLSQGHQNKNNKKKEKKAIDLNKNYTQILVMHEINKFQSKF